ncbi:unnamed protein product [Sphenostylis stenocarpa]|uniref:Magnesium transporter n=1 Tax=Sphenostylis stenocarpa TaxID=92480 RepID=A0AA86S9Z0_9FABA|nr:unnamed protein product [Sphenostylis stenocarpa]
MSSMSHDYFAVSLRLICNPGDPYVVNTSSVSRDCFTVSLRLFCDPCDPYEHMHQAPDCMGLGSVYGRSQTIKVLQRRLPRSSAGLQQQGDGKEYLGGKNDAETAEEDESPFEFRALEVALEAICSFLAARTTELEMAAYPALDELTSKISSRNLDRVRKLKSAMTRLTGRVQKVRDELEQLLDDDDDMADLYLSRKAGLASPVSGSGAANWFSASPTIGSKISRESRASLATVRFDENDVEELELLLEGYFSEIDHTLNKLTTLREYIDDTEDYINIQVSSYQFTENMYWYLFNNTKFWSFSILQLDNHRNQLIQLELFLSSGTVSLAFYSLVAAIFGMNMPYTWNEKHDYMFKWVVIVSGVFSVLMFVMIVVYARKKGLVGS